MATECQLSCSDEDDKLLDAAQERGVQDWSPETYEEAMPWVLEALTEKEEIIRERIQKVTSLMEAEPIEDIMLVHDSSEEPSSVEIRELKNRILEADPKSALIPIGERELPSFFTPGFKDVGEDLSEQLKDYPDDFAKVKMYSAIQPTLENLGRMLKERNPYSAWGEKINFHHFEQKSDVLVAMEKRLHQEATKELHQSKPLGEKARVKYQKQERPNILRTTAETYLGKYAQSKEIKDALISKANEVRKKKLGDDKNKSDCSD